MRGRYYYLVAGLPDIGLDDGRDCPDPVSFVEELASALPPDDAKFLDYLRLPIDNRNLGGLLDSSGRPFLSGGILSEETLRQGLHAPDLLPSHMCPVVEAWRYDIPLFYNVTWEDQLNWIFYEEAIALPNLFLSEWFTFDLNLRNFLTALRCHTRSVPLERRLDERMDGACVQAVIGRNDLAEALRSAVSPGSALAAYFPWAEEIMHLEGADLAAQELGVDRLRWEWLSEKTLFNDFDIEALLAFTLKLQLAWRWRSLSPEAGRERLVALLSALEGVPSAIEGEVRL